MLSLPVGAAGTVAGVVLDGVVLQGAPPVEVSPGASLAGVAGSAAGAFLTTLVIGAIMVALAPEYTRGRMTDVVEDPLGTFVYGVISLVFLLLVVLVLVFTVVGILLAVPLGLLAWVLWAVGSAVAFLAIADRLVGSADGWTKPLLVGAGINGLLALTGIGGIVSFCIGAAGFGAVLRHYL